MAATLSCVVTTTLGRVSYYDPGPWNFFSFLSLDYTIPI